MPWYIIEASPEVRMYYRSSGTALFVYLSKAYYLLQFKAWVKAHSVPREAIFNRHPSFRRLYLHNYGESSRLCDARKEDVELVWQKLLLYLVQQALHLSVGAWVKRTCNNVIYSDSHIVIRSMYFQHFYWSLTNRHDPEFLDSNHIRRQRRICKSTLR